MIEIRHCTVDNLFKSKNIDDVLTQYGVESSIHEMPVPSAQVAQYRQLETAGVLNIIAAFNGDDLCGFVAVLSSVLPHYGVLTSVTESLFVLKKYRQTNAGLNLIAAAENHALLKGSPGLLISAPTGGALSQLMPLLGYRNTNQVFFKRLGNG